MHTVVVELVSFLQALKSGSPIGYLILLAIVPICLALVIVALVYQRIAIKRSQKATRAIQQNLEIIAAADLRKRALEVKKHDEGQRKRELEERDKIKGSFKDADAELRFDPQCPQKLQHSLKRSQRALKESVSHTITLGFEDVQNRLRRFQRDGVSSSSQFKKADLQWKPDEGALNRIRSLSGKRVAQITK